MLAEQISQHGRLYFQLAWGVLREPTAAEDVCQQAFLKAWQEREMIRDSASLRAWLARVVVNESLQVLRRRKTEQRAMNDPGLLSRDVHDPSGETDLREAVLLAMARLPMPLQAAVAMRVMQGMSGNEVREILGCSAAEVSRRLHEGLERLRPLLAEWQVPGGR